MTYDTRNSSMWAIMRHLSKTYLTKMALSINEVARLVIISIIAFGILTSKV